MRSIIGCVLSALILTPAAVAQSGGMAHISSPSGKLAITVAVAPSTQPSSGDTRLIYSVAYDGKPLIDASSLKLELKGQPSPLGTNVRIVKSSITQHDQTYKLVAGKASSVRDHYFEGRIDLEDPQHRKLAIEARAYDDAVAFRYIVPEQPNLTEFRLIKETTEFRVAKDATTYALELPNYRSMYESEYIKLPISALTNQGGVPSSVLIGLPLLMHVPGVGWAAIAEADLRDYAAMYLTNPEGRWSGHWFESRIAPQVEHPDICVTGSLPHHTAWRVILVAPEDQPAKLIESNVLTSLNPESQIDDTSWIKPGKASWDWWSGSIGPDGNSAYTTDTMKYYVDFAAKSGLEYMLIDAGWSARNDITKMNGRVDVPAVVQYAREKGVKVWIWLHYSAVDRQREQAFPIFEQWGVAGLKIDFVERDDQQGIDFYYKTAELAAKHHLMLDFHGCTKPSGMQRTWPNLLGFEAVLGMEQSKGGTRDNPDNRVTLPFTRMLAGPMDYTPGGFNNVTREAFEPRHARPMVMGTRAQQLAMYVVYLAPIQMVSDCPQAYEGQEAFEFIKQVPATWDQTVAIDGQPGEFVTLARRHGDQWYLGSMTGWSARDIDVPLNFLGDGNYTAEIYADAPDADRDPKNVKIQKQSVTAKSHLRAHLAPGGGLAVRFTRAASPPNGG